MQLIDLLPQLIDLTKHIAAKILPIYSAQEDALLEYKTDGSPLTQADMLAHQLICARLCDLTPDYPVLSEESCDIPFSIRQNWQRYWLIDPIDGTKEFLAKNGEFTINIALIDQGQPIMGIVAAPVLQKIYYALQGEGAWKENANLVEPLIVQAYDAEKPLRVVASRSHGAHAEKQLSQHYSQIELMRRGSSLKFCLLAEGTADFYPRLGPTSQWDTAAGQCILEQAGGMVIDLQGNPLRYFPEETYLNPYFLAAADKTIFWRDYFLHAD